MSEEWIGYGIVPFDGGGDTLREGAIKINDLLYPSLISRVVTVPPVEPSDGDKYLVPAVATGLWAGWDDKIAAFRDGDWRFYNVEPGFFGWVIDESKLIIWEGAQWGDYDLSAVFEAVQNANDWAEKPHGVEIEPGKYSSLHWSVEALNNNGGVLTIDGEAPVAGDVDLSDDYLAIAGTSADSSKLGNQPASNYARTDTSEIFNSNVTFNMGAYFGAMNSEIIGLVGSSAFGQALYGPANAHMVVALRENDGGDSFAIVSGGGNYLADHTFDTIPFKVKSNGEITAQGEPMWHGGNMPTLVTALDTELGSAAWQGGLSYAESDVLAYPAHTVSWTHTKGVAPVMSGVKLIRKTATKGYAVGDELTVTTVFGPGSTDLMMSVIPNATTIDFYRYDDGSYLPDADALGSTIFGGSTGWDLKFWGLWA